jgi:RNA:NAD 2'-phosphotransferase (TPT1/KptA family)
MTATIRRLRAQLAAATRHHPDQDHTDLRRDLGFAKLEALLLANQDTIRAMSEDEITRLEIIIGIKARP